MRQTLPFNEHVAEYEEWFEKYPMVFQSEVRAIRSMISNSEQRGVEIAAGTGRFAQALGIHEGVEPADNMRKAAQKRGVHVTDAEAEKLPYGDQTFDYAIMCFCISYLKSVQFSFKEAYRILKPHGYLVVGFLEKDSVIARQYTERKHSLFYKDAVFYSAERVVNELRKAGFQNFEFAQTLFGSLDGIQKIQHAQPGFGKGSFVVIRATK